MRLRALIVEDSEDDSKLLVRALTKEGFEVVSRRVETAEAMRAALDEAPWDVVLSDNSMPRFSALGALETLKQSGLDLPFIIVSGRISEDAAIKTMKSGAHDYIMKGNLARLVSAIRRDLRVLIVEDSEDDAKLLVRALTKEGFEVVSRRVETAEAMRAALDEASWDVVLADHTMPRFSAFGALETLKQSGLDLPFIIVSGLIGEDVAVEAMKAGAHDYVMKDRVARLVPAIRRELRDATVRRERRLADEALRAAYAELERRVEERTAELAATNEELAATIEELTATSDDLRRANLELAATNEKLHGAMEELRLHKEREIAVLKDLDRLRDEFLSVAAHELRTPVTTLQGFAQALLRRHEKKGTIEPHALNHGLETIVRQAKKLTMLLSQLLDLSRIEGGRLALDRKCVDLVRIVGDVAAAARLGAAQREITVQAPARAEAFVDPLRIEQVITNLVNNAIQYSPDGPVEIVLAATKDTLEVAVRDHGIGIHPDHLPHIFERFYQAHGARHPSGLGLGLYVCDQIVTLHGGRIQVEAPPDGGTRFLVILPGCSEPRAGFSPAEADGDGRVTRPRATVPRISHGTLNLPASGNTLST